MIPYVSHMMPMASIMTYVKIDTSPASFRLNILIDCIKGFNSSNVEAVSMISKGLIILFYWNDYR